jgi:hypothetical protein
MCVDKTSCSVTTLPAGDPGAQSVRPAVVVLDHFNWGGQAGASCTGRGASYIRRYCCHIIFFTALQA